jgi:acylphosphatase
MIISASRLNPTHDKRKGKPLADDLKQLHAIVHGRVQGVNFRYYTQEQAIDLDVVGWVRNLPDRTVEVTAEGSPDQLEKLLKFLHRGPISARVTRVEATWHRASGRLKGFNVRF